MRDIQRYDGMIALDNAEEHLGVFADMVARIKSRPDDSNLHVPNVMLNGMHGTGKTSMVKAVCVERGLKLAVLTGSTLDVFVHIMGIPVISDAERERKTIEFVRSADLGIDDADVILVDETNRAPRETRNALFEILLSHSINGVALPNLKWCIAAINPVDLYSDTYELDHAMLDRFPVKLTTAPAVKHDILTMCGVGDEVAASFHTWWNGTGEGGAFAAGRDMLDRMHSCGDPQAAMLQFISPRTITEAALAYEHTGSLDTLGLFFGTEEQRTKMAYGTLVGLLENCEVETGNVLGGQIDTTAAIYDVMSVIEQPARLQELAHQLQMSADNLTLQEEIANGIVRAYQLDDVDTNLLIYITNQLVPEMQESVKARIGEIHFDD